MRTLVFLSRSWPDTTTVSKMQKLKWYLVISDLYISQSRYEFRVNLHRGIKRVWAAALSTGHCELPLSWTDPENISLENSVRAAHPPHLDQTPGRPQLVVKVHQAVQRLLSEVELGQELPQLGALRDQAEESLGQQGPGRQVVVSFTFTIS